MTYFLFLKWTSGAFIAGDVCYDVPLWMCATVKTCNFTTTKTSKTAMCLFSLKTAILHTVLWPCTVNIINMNIHIVVMSVTQHY